MAADDTSEERARMPGRPRGLAELEAGYAAAGPSPADEGVLEMIVRRPAVDAREVLDEGLLDPAVGLTGDNWHLRRSSRTADGRAHPDRQITLMNARVAALVAHEREHWSLAGDQLFADLDLGPENLPAGTRLQIGEAATVEVTSEAHTGCGKFAERFGVEALEFVNGTSGRARRLRGIYARVVSPGIIRRGDLIRKSRGR